MHPYKSRPIADTHIWLTPPDIIGPLGEFDLDPCAAPSPRPWDTALRHIELPHEFRSANSVLVERATIKRDRMIEILSAAVEADRQDHLRGVTKMMPSDAEILACLRPLYSNDVAAAMGAEDDLRTAHLLLSRYGSGQPTVCQECGGDGAGGLHEDDCSQNSIGQPAASAEPPRVVAWRARDGHGGPQAFDQDHDDRWYCIDAHGAAHACKGREDAYDTAAVADQCYPQNAPHMAAMLVSETTLADTQRAIIEAAERRGYERAEAENVGYRTDAGRYRFIRLLTGDRLDAAIDAARAAKEQS